MTHVRRWMIVFLLLPVFLAPAAQETRKAATWEQVSEHWYTVELGGGQAGWMAETVETDGQRYRRVSHVHISIGRGPVSATVELESTFVETQAGEPLTMRLVQTTAQQPVEYEWRFEADHVVQTTRQGGRETVKEQPLPEGTWLTPMATHRYWLQRREAGEKQITYHTIDAQNGLDPVEISHEYVGEEDFAFDGRTVPVTVWTTTTSLLPISAREKYSAEGHLISQEVDAPFGKMVTRLATKSQALGGNGGEAPQLLIKTFVKPSKPIGNSLGTTSARLRLRVSEGSMPTLPTAGAQRLERSEDGRTATVIININENQAAADVDSASFLESSAMVDSDDELIRALAARAAHEVEDNSMAKAEAMRAFVHRHVSDKGLDTAFATASETARMKTGDCSEHAVLLCALLRAQAIPARVSIGLIYADSFLGERGIFGWHMWTQALIDGKWVDFDATLPKRYHAAHVLTATSNLGDGTLNAELASTLGLMGNLTIEVLDVGYE